MSRVAFGAWRSQSKRGNAFQEGHSQNKRLASIEIVGCEVLLGGEGLTYKTSKWCLAF
jgi:hypothetical protein